MRTSDDEKFARLPWDEADNPGFVLEDTLPETEKAEPSSGQTAVSVPAHRLSFRMKRKSKSTREKNAIHARWEKAQSRLFLEERFLTVILEVMTKFHSFEVRNVILTAVQRPKATRLAAQSSWRGLGVEIKAECLKNPIWLYAKEHDMRPGKFYDISQTNGEEVYAVRRTVYNTKAVVQIVMSLLDELKIVYREDAAGIEFSVEEPICFVAPTNPMRSFEELLFEAVKALAQRDMVLLENIELSEKTRYIAEAAAFVVCGYFEMLPEKKQVVLPETMRSDEMHCVVEDLECARRIARHYITTIRNRLRSKKWREVG